MKLRNIYVLCRDNYEVIKGITAQNVNVNGRSGMRVSGWFEAGQAASSFLTVPELDTFAKKLINAVPVFERNNDTFHASEAEWNKIRNARDAFLEVMDCAKAIYRATGEVEEEKTGIDIKLPKYNDFSDFVKSVNELEFVLTKCPFLQSEETKLEFENVDVGTTWLTFFVVGASITTISVFLNNVLSFVDKCITIRSHYLTLQKQKMDLEKEKRDEEKKKSILEYLDDMYKVQVDTAIAELEEITKHKVADPDEKDRIKLSFEKMGELIDKGLQIYSTIDSPKEVQVLFEPLETKYIELEKKIQLLEDKEE